MSGQMEQDSRTRVKGAGQRRAPHCLIDGFLDDAFASALLDHVVSHKDGFSIGGVLDRDGSLFVDEKIRTAYKLPFGGNALADRFAAKLADTLPRLSEECGQSVVEEPVLDIDIAAYRNGGLYTPHIDTLTHAARETSGADRILSIIYYLHRQPSGFEGGELALYPIVGQGKPDLIAPKHNRLIAFPSFVQHEVKRVSSPDDTFENARFSINCWVLRPRD